MMKLIDLSQWSRIRQLMYELRFPETEESVIYGMPAYTIRNMFFCRLREDGITLMIYSDTRDFWIDDQSGAFFITEHYRNYSYLFCKLEAIDWEKLKGLFMQSWKERAPHELLSEWAP